MRVRTVIRRPVLVLGLVILAVGLGCPFRISVVQGDSMSPTFSDGTLCVIDRSYYLRYPVARGDIIVFRQDDVFLTKRVYGIPGDTLTLLYYPEDGTYEIPTAGCIRMLRRSPEVLPWVRLVRLRLPPDRYFVLGDNAAGSEDSRAFGPISGSAILGKMVATLPQRTASAGPVP